MRDDDVQRVCGPDDLIMHETFERDYGFVPDDSQRADNLSEASASGPIAAQAFIKNLKTPKAQRSLKRSVFATLGMRPKSWRIIAGCTICESTERERETKKEINNEKLLSSCSRFL